VFVSLRFAYLVVLRVFGWLALLARSDRVLLGNSASCRELGFCCGIGGIAGTISGCCCPSSTAW
jgi:hypothetical protein